MIARRHLLILCWIGFYKSLWLFHSSRTWRSRSDCTSRGARRHSIRRLRRLLMRQSEVRPDGELLRRLNNNHGPLRTWSKHIKTIVAVRTCWSRLIEQMKWRWVSSIGVYLLWFLHRKPLIEWRRRYCNMGKTVRSYMALGIRCVGIGSCLSFHNKKRPGYFMY